MENQKLDERTNFSTYTAENLNNFRDSWEQIKSTNMQYNADTDIFDSIILARILDRIEESAFVLIIRHAFRYLSFFVTIIALGLASFNPTVDADFLGDGSDLQNLLYIASFMGLSEQITEHNYLFLLIISMASLLVSNIVIDIRVGALKKSIKTITQQEIEKLDNMRQIYPGSGSIKFSAGSEGFAIQSDNFDMLFQWSCLEDIWFVERKGTKWNLIGQYREFAKRAQLANSHDEEDSDAGELYMKDARREFYSKLEKATHVFMVLKPTSNRANSEVRDRNASSSPDKEFIVVPKEFFENPRSGNGWSEFWPILQDARPI